MDKGNDNQGGRPPRYDGEKSERVAAVIRPRYKRMIEMIANDRQTTLSEAVEFAIIQLAKSYKVDESCIYDLLVNDASELDASLDACLWGTAITQDSAVGSGIIDLYKHEIKQYADLPRLAKTRQTDYINLVYRLVGANIMLYFEDTKIRAVISEQFKLGTNEIDLSNAIKEKISAIQSKKTK